MQRTLFLYTQLNCYLLHYQMFSLLSILYPLLIASSFSFWHYLYHQTVPISFASNFFFIFSLFLTKYVATKCLHITYSFCNFLILPFLTCFETILGRFSHAHLPQQQKFLCQSGPKNVLSPIYFFKSTSLPFILSTW